MKKIISEKKARKRRRAKAAAVWGGLLVLVLWTACGSGPAKPETAETRVLPDLPPGYAARRVTVSAPLSPAGKGWINMNIDFLESAGSERVTRRIGELLYSGQEPEGYQKSLLAEYRNLYGQDPGAPALSAGWEYWEILTIRDFRGRGLVLGREQYVYTGGAHGAQAKMYYVIDLESLHVMTLADFFRDPQGPELEARVMAALRRYGGLTEEQPLSTGIFFEDQAGPSPNFYITEEGLGFRWDPYEIAPYSEGGIEVLLSWKTIRPLLKHEAMELLAAFGIYLFVS
jgi:hypothetical protein